MSRIQGDTTAANVIQQTPIKLKNSEKSDNVPAKQLIAKVQVLTTQIKEKQHDIEQESKRLQDILDTRDLDASEAKQIARVVHSLQRQVEALSEKLTEIHAVIGSSAHVDVHAHDSDGPTMVVTFGYVGEAERALNELQVQLNHLQQLQRAINTAILDSQRGGETKDANGKVVQHVGTIAAMAQAANASANADAINKWIEAGKDMAQVVVSGVSMLMTNKNYKEYKEQSTGPEGGETKLNNVKAFQNDLKNTPQAQPAITGGAAGTQSRPAFSPQERAQLRDLTEGVGPYQAGTSLNVRQHIMADDELRLQTREYVSKELNNAELQKNTEATSYQTSMQTTNMVFDMAKTGVTALGSGAQAIMDGTKKGPAEASRQLSQYANEQQSQAINAGAQAAQAVDQQTLQLNQAKEKANSQSQ
jgi:hypothetical protein